MSGDYREERGYKDWWHQSFVRNWWKTEVWPNTYHLFTTDVDRPPFFWLRPAIYNCKNNSIPINFWEEDDTYSFRVLRMADVAVPLGVAKGAFDYAISGHLRLWLEKRTRTINTLTSTIKDACRVPIRQMLSHMPKSIGLVFGMGTIWAVTLSLADDYHKKDIAEMFRLPFGVAKYGYKEPYKHSVFHHGVAGVAAAATHHVLAGGSWGEPKDLKKLSNAQRHINNRSLRLLILLPIIGAFARYMNVINEYQMDRIGASDDFGGPARLSTNEHMKYKAPPKYDGVEGGAKDHKGRDISWLFPKVPKEREDGDYVPKLK